ncbi:hypothetical protein HPB51_015604 [Rhipicephalus microplus]|uniref:Uncharacterized protein n=1 Tax=Rhipicephalus microplus TaxID=6941 RepID=A0A9J6DHK3_RHIMP|nr:hypothetical protein HPB51_015604 [Rhipicephalus microplus]
MQWLMTCGLMVKWVLFVEDEKLVDLKYVRKAPRAKCIEWMDEEKLKGPDGSIRLHIGRVHLVLLLRFFIELQVAEMSHVMLELCIDIHAPTVLVPQKSDSPNLLVLSLGDLSIENFFKEISMGPKLDYVDNILVHLSSLHMTREKLLGSAAATAKRCRLCGLAFLDVEEFCAGDADDTSDTIDQASDIVDEACKTLLAEVLEQQGVTEGIYFLDFRDAHSNVQTSTDMSDEAIVASVVEVSPINSDEDDMESDNTGDPGPTVAEAAHCVSVMRVFAEKRGLAEKLAHSISEFEAAFVLLGGRIIK